MVFQSSYKHHIAPSFAFKQKRSLQVYTDHNAQLLIILIYPEY